MCGDTIRPRLPGPPPDIGGVADRYEWRLPSKEEDPAALLTGEGDGGSGGSACVDGSGCPLPAPALGASGGLACGVVCVATSDKKEPSSLLDHPTTQTFHAP